MSCIQMKLDDNVTDSNLRKIDEWAIQFNSSINRQFEVHAPSAQTITARIVGNGQFYSDSSFTTPIGKTVTLSSANWIMYLGQGTYTVYLSNKYNITLIKSLPESVQLNHELSIDYKYLGYLNNWFSIDLHGVSAVNFDKLALDKLYELRMYNCNVNCDIADIASKLNPGVNFGRFAFDDGMTYGDSTILGDLPIWNSAPNGTAVSVRRRSIDQPFTGTYDVFCDKLHAAGKVSGTLYVHMAGDPIEDGAYLITFSDSGWTRQ